MCMTRLITLPSVLDAAVSHMNYFVSGDAHATSCQRLVDRSVEVAESKTSIVHASSKPPLGCLSPSVPLQFFLLKSTLFRC